MPDESRWIIHCYLADATSASLRKRNRRGMPVMPAELEWIVKRGAADPTSGSLQADPTSASLRRLPKRSPPYIPLHAVGKLSPSPRAGRAGEGLT